MPSTILGVSARALLETCAELGLDADAIALRAGVDRRALQDPEHRLPAALVGRVWREAFAITTDPTLALRAAEAVPPGAYRVLDYAAAASATLGDAIERVVSYFGLVGGATLELERTPRALRLRLASAQPLPLPAQEYTLAAVVLRTRHGCGIPWTPTDVSFSAPRPSDVSLHARIFGVAPRFDAEHATLTVADSDCRRASSRADPLLASILDAHARELVSRLPASEGFAASVSAQIERALRGGDASVEEVARALATTERTLQRRLRAEKTSFAALLSSTRERAARAHLARPDVAIAEVAWLLGFSEQSAFTRAFRRWTGMTPARYRASVRASV